MTSFDVVSLTGHFLLGIIIRVARRRRSSSARRRRSSGCAC